MFPTNYIIIKDEHKTDVTAFLHQLFESLSFPAFTFRPEFTVEATDGSTTYWLCPSQITPLDTEKVAEENEDYVFYSGNHYTTEEALEAASLTAV